MLTSFAIVFIFRAVPCFAAGIFNFERPMPAPMYAVRIPQDMLTRIPDVDF